jgi:CHASE2 domain-containing sensor protein
MPGSNDQCSLPRNKVPRPACVRIGNINLPNDARQIPLVTPTIDSDSGANSLALAAAAAHDDAIDLSPRTRGKKIIDKAIQDNDFVVGSFIPQSGFQTIAAEKLFQGNQDEIQKCRGRIILIGGDWREASGNGEPVDTYNTPVGPMAGMFIHANYIEALLDDRYQRIVPLPFGLAFDLLVGILLYISFHQAVTARGKLKVLGVFLLPLLASYVIFANFNWYLDFVLPLMACFAHLIFEWVRSYQELRRRAAAHATGGLE